MNERIKELVKQMGWEEMEADLNRKTKYGCMTTHAIEKFAKLVVWECLTIVNRKEYSYHEADPLWETAELIKEHFGMGN